MRIRNFFAVCFIAVSFLAVSPGFPIADSLDHWHWRNPLPQGNPLAGVTYGNGVSIAVGREGTILSSSDNGVTWINRKSGTSEDLYAVANDAGVFVTVGVKGTQSLLLRTTE